MRVINLTQHVATKEQIASGVFDVSEEYMGWLKEIMTFDEIPGQKDLDDRAHDLGLLQLCTTWLTMIVAESCSLPTL